jgi:hypothetical protein
MLQTFDLPSSSMWWVRFAVSLAGDLLVAGNGAGKVFLWDPSDSRGGAAESTLSHKGCTRVVGGGGACAAARGDTVHGCMRS